MHEIQILEFRHAPHLYAFCRMNYLKDINIELRTHKSELK